MPYLGHALSTFGAEQCLFGGDWPVASLATTYAQWRDIVTRAVTPLGRSALQAVFDGSARHVYDLDGRALTANVDT